MQKRKGEEYNLLPVAEDYFNTIFGEIGEMKGLILDSETSGIISIIYTQSKLYKNDVYLIQKIEDVREKLMHLKAVYFVRPTKENVALLKQEIANPHFKEYHIFFTNEIPESFIAELAEADTSDRIKNLQEVYLDYYAVGRNIFSLKIPSTVGLLRRRDVWGEADKGLITRISDGLISALMSLRVLPQVRFLAESDCCGEIAKRVAKKLEDELMKKPSDYPRE
jgi:vacuolar protein sorting-associated protein 45